MTSDTPVCVDHLDSTTNREEGDGGLANALLNSFAVAKSAGLKVLVTTSHQAPYNMPDGAAVMNAVFSSTNVDYVSPQLYNSGSETANDWSLSSAGTNSQINWSTWRNSKAKVLPAIASGGLCNDAKSTFANTYGISTVGCATWTW
jgi:chitinase